MVVAVISLFLKLKLKPWENELQLKRYSENLNELFKWSSFFFYIYKLSLKFEEEKLSLM